ncbi:hypothetical protein ACGFYA_33370 [Streptomyces sp. NPDC048305]|uniref:hypothetical protein n=1 Tax=Streptomyces sp. NPDC048305 TaxID=3365532 RepID=UPI003711ACA2
MRRRTVTAGNLDELLQMTDPAAQANEPVAAPPAAAGPPPGQGQGLRTEFEFELPRGYVDEAGTVHRHGAMRLATARDELRPQIDLRVKENPAYLSVVLLSQVITRIGDITDVHAGVVERMYATDVAFLQDFYRRVNSEGHTRAAVTCPHCEGHFEVDLSGGRLGES